MADNIMIENFVRLNIDGSDSNWLKTFSIDFNTLSV